MDSTAAAVLSCMKPEQEYTLYTLARLSACHEKAVRHALASLRETGCVEMRRNPRGAMRFTRLAAADHLIAAVLQRAADDAPFAHTTRPCAQHLVQHLHGYDETLKRQGSLAQYFRAQQATAPDA